MIQRDVVPALVGFVLPPNRLSASLGDDGDDNGDGDVGVVYDNMTQSVMLPKPARGDETMGDETIGDETTGDEAKGGEETGEEARERTDNNDKDDIIGVTMMGTIAECTCVGIINVGNVVKCDADDAADRIGAGVNIIASLDVGDVTMDIVVVAVVVATFVVDIVDIDGIRTAMLACDGEGEVRA